MTISLTKFAEFKIICLNRKTSKKIQGWKDFFVQAAVSSQVNYAPGEGARKQFRGKWFKRW